MTFTFFIGGYFSSHTEITYADNELRCVIEDRPAYGHEPNHIFSVENDPDWDNVVNYLASVKWKKEYDDPGIMDGTQWELEFTHNETSLTCVGSNEFPRGFTRFLKLINTILSKNGIRTA